MQLLEIVCAFYSSKYYIFSFSKYFQNVLTKICYYDSYLRNIDNLLIAFDSLATGYKIVDSTMLQYYLKSIEAGLYQRTTSSNSF